jgi:hypothetical protein
MPSLVLQSQLRLDSSKQNFADPKSLWQTFHVVFITNTEQVAS